MASSQDAEAVFFAALERAIADYNAGYLHSALGSPPRPTLEMSVFKMAQELAAAKS